VKRFDHRSDVTVLEDAVFALRCFLDDNVHHGKRQVVGPDRPVGEEHPKRRVDRAQEAIVKFGSFRDATG